MTRTFNRDANRFTHDRHAANLRAPQLVSAFRHLVLLCDRLPVPWTVICGRDPKGGFPGSSTDRTCRTIWLATEEPSGEPRAAEHILVSLAHEVGHVHDPPRRSDGQLVMGSPQYRRRELEREEAAWQWAEQHLSKLDAWELVSDVFARMRSQYVAAYRSHAGSL